MRTANAGTRPTTTELPVSGRDCDGRIRHVGEQFGDLVEDAISNFDDRYITHYQEYQESLESERVALRTGPRTTARPAARECGRAGSHHA